jgi:DNA-binding MarR family transcriptional regulator
MSTQVSRRVRRAEALAQVDAALTRIGRIGGSRRAAQVRAERSRVPLSRLGAAVLASIYRRGPVNLRDVAAAVDTQPSRVSKEVNGLRDLGFVTGQTDPDDARAQLLTVTAAGRRAFEDYRAAADDLLAEVLGKWTDGELDGLAAMLQRLASDFGGR